MSSPGPVEYDFDRAVRLTPTGSPELSLADLPASWSVHGGPMNGGITLAVAANALSAPLNQMHGHPDPLCVSAFFLSAADPGPAQVRTEVIRGSRSMSTATASIIQPDATGSPPERLRVTGSFTDLGAAPPHVLTVARPPYMPARRVLHHRHPARLPPGRLGSDAALRDADRPATAGWFEGTPTGLGHMRAWFRMRDGRAPSTIMLFQVVDALPPLAYDLGVCGWVPTWFPLWSSPCTCPPNRPPGGCGSAPRR
jgi:hypothetical protein